MDPSSFSSVNKFLEAAKAAKEPERQRIEEVLAPAVHDPHAFTVPPSMLPALDDLLENYGDEALKSIGMFCIGRWSEIHQERLQAFCDMEDMQGALWTMSDMSKLSTALQILADVGSFGGSDEWDEMITKEVSKALHETLEEDGTLNDFLARNHPEGED